MSRILISLMLTCYCTFSTADAAKPSKASPRCEYGSPNTDAAKEFGQFEFLIGDFSVEPDAWFQGDWHSGQVPIPARWNDY
jgi:hypothetical protein